MCKTFLLCKILFQTPETIWSWKKAFIVKKKKKSGDNFFNEKWQNEIKHSFFLLREKSD